MKVIVLLLASFLTSAAFASKTEILCTERGQSSLSLQIFYNNMTFKIEGISLFNTSIAQTALNNFKESIGQRTYYSYFISVVLADETQILVPSVVLDGKTKGIVHTGTGLEFNCN